MGKLRIVKEKSNDGTKYLFIFFRLLGILMPEKYKFPYVIYSIVVNSLSIIIVPLTFTLSYLTGIKDMPMKQLLSSLQISINIYACVAKFLIIAIKKQNLLKIKAVTDELDDQTTHPDEVREIRKVIKFAHRMIFLFCILYYSYSTSAALGSVLDGYPPFSLYNPFFDWRASRANFVIVSLMEFFMVNIVCLQDMANNTFAVIYIRIMHTQVKIIMKRVSRIGCNPDTSQEENLAELRHCIENHRKLVDLCDTLEAIISLTVFIQFITSGIPLGIVIINIIAFPDKSTIMESFFFIGCVVIELLPMCYYAECFTADAQRLSEKIFHLNWMDQNKAFQQNCIIFMHRSQKSMAFFAGKIFPISLDTFIAIMKFAFSLYTFLSTMNFLTKFNQQ